MIILLKILLAISSVYGYTFFVQFCFESGLDAWIAVPTFFLLGFALLFLNIFVSCLLQR